MPGPDADPGSALKVPGSRLLHGDNLVLMRQIAEDPEVRGRVALVYMDPPFNTGGAFHVGGKNGGRAPSEIPAYRDAEPLDEYLKSMQVRFEALRPLLTENASVFVHADARVVHYLKVILDGIFGRQRFVNEIVWRYKSGGVAKSCYAAKHDTILWYANGPGHVFNADAVGVPAARSNHMKRVLNASGEAVRTIRSNGKIYEYAEDRLVPPCDVWDDISHLNQRDPERTGYATQKPEALLARIILGSSNPGDLVLDPFCGSGTTLAVAQKNGRRWIGIDASEAAIEIARRRLDVDGP
jgi:site-specific DNA-methyltransferase (adenine-specific)/adenine-specific DNA-methyltransferase